MTLSDIDKQKIKDEEEYRSEIRSSLSEPASDKKKGIGCGSAILVMFTLIVVTAVIMSVVSETPNTNPKSTPTPAPSTKELVGKINFDGTQFHITNQESEKWQHCWFTLNSKYHYPTNALNVRLDSIEPGETVSIGAGAFTLKDGTRFNPFSTKPKDISASCDQRFGYWNWN